MTITEIIEKAGEDFSRNHTYAHDRMLLEEGFEAGASFVLSSPEVLREVLKPFAEWMLKEGIEPGVMFTGWKNHHFIPAISFTTEELISKYITETIKLKEDEVGKDKAV